MNRNPDPRVYFIRPVGQDGPIKVGHSSQVPLRLREFNKWSPILLEVVAMIQVPDAFGIHYRSRAEKFEWSFHMRYADHRLHHEWFAPHPLILDDIAAINAGTFDASALTTWHPKARGVFPNRCPERTITDTPSLTPIGDVRQGLVHGQLAEARTFACET